MASTAYQLNKNSQLERKRLFKIIGIVIVVGIVGTVGFLLLMRQPSFFIKNVEISGARAVDPTAIDRKVEEYLAGQRLYVVPNRNIILFSKESLSTWISREIPSIDRVEVSFDGQKNMTIAVHEKNPYALWCQDKQCFFVDDHGGIYQEAPQFSDGIFIIISGTPKENPIGQSVAEPSVFEYVKELLATLDTILVHVVEIILGDALALRVDRLGGIPVTPHTKLMVQYQYDVATLGEALSHLIQDPVFEKSLQEKGESFEYLDLRTPGKIYYKFLDESSHE